MDEHEQMMNRSFPEPLLSAVQVRLFMLDFWLAVRIASNRGPDLLVGNGNAPARWLLPMLVFIGAITALNLRLIAQGMVMRS